MGVVRCVGNTGSQSHAPGNTVGADFLWVSFMRWFFFFFFFFFCWILADGDEPKGRYDRVLYET